MYKIIDLGHEVPETGEARVSLIKPSLIKTASSEIQEFWDAIPQDPRYSYLWVIGVSAREYYGCNNTGDAFNEADLQKTHQDFVDSANVFLQHVNKDPAKAIGKPVFSWYNDTMHRVELILRIDKSKPDAAGTVSKITAGEPIYASMGCTVAYDVCSICGNKAPTRRDYCDHLRFNMRKILPDGRQVCALNPNPKFFDISIVAKPADPTAHTLDKRASLRGMGAMEQTVSSAELGEISLETTQKLAALKKISDIIKKVDGVVVDRKAAPAEKDDQPLEQGLANSSASSTNHSAEADRDFPTLQVNAVIHLAGRGFHGMEYPVMPYEQLSSLQVSPADFLMAMHSFDAPFSLGDAAWLAGNHVLGRCPSSAEMGSLFRHLPHALDALQERPSLMDQLLTDFCRPCQQQDNAPLKRILFVRIMRPVATRRVEMLRTMIPGEDLKKVAAAFGHPQENMAHYGRNLLDSVVKFKSML